MREIIRYLYLNSFSATTCGTTYAITRSYGELWLVGDIASCS